MLKNIHNFLPSFLYKKINFSFRSYAMVALIVVMFLSTSSVLAVPGPGLVAVGPTASLTGYPSWYKDSNGTRLELCLDGGLNPICGYLPGDIPNPAAPISVPDNYPTTGEAFYMLGSAIMETDSATGGRAILVLALEAAFSGGTAVPGDQITFGRVRIWIDNLIPSAQYRVTHPYGVDNFTADPVFGRRMIRYVEDIGIGSPGDFTGAMNSRIGPFLAWDPAILPAAPAGYIGDPDVLHPVTGSPLDTNYFRVEGPAGSFPGSVDQCTDPALGDDPIATDDCIQMDQFSLIGKYATNADVNANRATYTQSNADGGRIDVFANTEPGMDIQVDGFGSPVLIPDGNGYYFGQVNYNGNPPAQLQITNTSDTPDSTKSISVVDLVTITKADFNADTGMLRVDAISSDTFNDPILTAVGFGALDNSGKLEVPGLAIPPQNVTVTSARGGSATVAVVVSVVPDVCYSLTVGHAGAGSDPTADPSNSLGCGLGMYFPGENITLSGAVPSIGSQITGWTGTSNNAATSSGNAFTMPSTDHVVGVNYADIPPSVISSTRLNASPSNRATVFFTVTFSESVTGVSVADFSVNTSGTISGVSVSSVTGTGSTRTVGVNTGTGNGTIRLDLIDDDSIVDIVGTSLGSTGAGNGNFSTGEVYTMDKTAPTVVSSVLLNPNPTTRTTVFFLVTFSESVTGVSAADFSLTNSGISGSIVTSVTGTGTTRTVGVSTGTGSGTILLNVIDDDSILDGAGNRLGGTGTGNGNFTTGLSYNVR